ncbi:hypothetical protein HDU93_005316 [Gonapodya sp. JEL0774]|nr:hypothetical protein HDU93_005316 [Gonapodya sp. JEL0774]
MKSKLCKLQRVALVYDLYLRAGRVNEYELTFGGSKYTNWNKLYEAINKNIPKNTVHNITMASNSHPSVNAPGTPQASRGIVLMSGLLHKLSQQKIDYTVTVRTLASIFALQQGVHEYIQGTVPKPLAAVPRSLTNAPTTTASASTIPSLSATPATLTASVTTSKS